MSRKKTNNLLPRKINTYADQSRLVMRKATVREDTVNTDAGSVEVVIATENPVQRFDVSRGEVIDEILAMDGVEFRSSRRQLPIVDSHDRSSVSNVLGSVRNIRVQGDEMVGDAFFANDETSQRAFEKVRAGHLTDFSITATPNEILQVDRGSTYNFNGTEVAGPADIVTRWQPTDASLVVTGADARSTVRDSLIRSYQIPLEKEDDMSQEPVEQQETPEDTESVKVQTEQQEAVAAVAVADEPSQEESEAMSERQLTDAVDRALKQDRERCAEIRALCSKHNIERQLTDQLCDDGTSLDQARAVILDKIAEIHKPVGEGPSDEVTRVNVESDGRERLTNALRDGLIKRAVSTAGYRSPFTQDNPAAQGSDDFSSMSLIRMAERLLTVGGVDITRMNSRDVAMVAMGHKPTIQRLRIERAGEAYHTTGVFANLLLDAANKTLLAGYEEAPFTWNSWARQAASVADFKNINRIRFSEVPDLKVVPENTDYGEGIMSDSKESYKVEKYGSMFTVTWETVVNDDLDAISRVPAMQGVAARRVQNKKVYEVLTDNDTLSDGVALFASGHSNLDASGAAPSVAELNAAFTDMMTQTGLSSDAIINVQPRYLIVPAALAGTALELVGSTANPAAGGSAAGSSGVQNIYGPNGPRGGLQVVVEPQLDGNSTTAWYLAADPSQIDTVELSFLQGEESPVLESEFEFDKDVWKYKVRQTFGVKAIDYRGLYKNPGA